MSEHKYSVSEIDRMRDMLDFLWESGRPYRQDEKRASVEDRLRTHMTNGTTVAELEAAVVEKFGSIPVRAYFSGGRG